MLSNFGKGQAMPASSGASALGVARWSATGAMRPKNQKALIFNKVRRRLSAARAGLNP
jgi:hypothetical protein